MLRRWFHLKIGVAIGGDRVKSIAHGCWPYSWQAVAQGQTTRSDFTASRSVRGMACSRTWHQHCRMAGLKETMATLEVPSAKSLDPMYTCIESPGPMLQGTAEHPVASV